MKAVFLVATGMLLATPGIGFAQDEASDWSVEGTVGLVSDYRFRGLSLSGGDPVLQAGVTLSHTSGLYADAYLSGIEEYGVGEDGDGADLEVTLTAGWAGSWLGLDWDAALSAYKYPDGDDVDYLEAPIQASKAFGAYTATVGMAYAPAQSALGDEDNRYVWAGLDHTPETWPISLSVAVGYEEGAWAPDGKTDWRVGAFLPLGPLTAGVEWIESDAESGALVASAFASF